jgi:Leucine-rich repeat (LRR) protein
MKNELHPNNEFGFCDTHHYLLRAFKVHKDRENPDSLPKLDIDLTKLGYNTSCIRELKIEEFSTDSIPNVVLECMHRFPNLIRVQMSKCGLTSIRGIETCSTLKTLEVDGNEIQHLHHGFEKLKHTLQVREIWGK